MILKLAKYLSLLFFGLNFVSSQNLDCQKFHNGNFTAEMYSPISFKWRLSRNGTNQIEEVTDFSDQIETS